MIRLVYRDPRFYKQKDLLYKAGKRAALAVRTAEAIIENITSGAAPREAGLLTHHGEYRIENCMKFDLGSGYRLITSKQQDQLWVLFIGTHDECHRWLENNRGWNPEFMKKGVESLPVEDSRHMNMNLHHDPNLEDPQDYLNHIHEKDLREIFRGLCGR